MDYKVITNSKKIDIEYWSSFVKKHPKGNVFQSPEFFFSTLKSKDWSPFIIFILVDNDIKGLLLIINQKEGNGIKSFFTSRNIIWGGPLITEDKYVSIILSEYNKLFGKKVIYSQIRNLFDMSDYIKCFHQKGYEFIEHLDIHNSLKYSSDELLSNMNKERRHNVRRAIRKGLNFEEVISANDLMISYALIQNLYRRLKLPLPGFEFFKIFFINSKNDNVFKCFIAKFEEKIISTRYVLCYGGVIYDWYAASDSDYLNLYPNDFLPFKIMEWGISNNYEVFDFGGAGKPGKEYGVRDYKLKFGGQLVNYGRFTKINKKIIYKIGEVSLKMLHKLKKK